MIFGINVARRAWAQKKDVVKLSVDQGIAGVREAQAAVKRFGPKGSHHLRSDRTIKFSSHDQLLTNKEYRAADERQ